MRIVRRSRSWGVRARGRPMTGNEGDWVAGFPGFRSLKQTPSWAIVGPPSGRSDGGGVRFVAPTLAAKAKTRRGWGTRFRSGKRRETNAGPRSTRIASRSSLRAGFRRGSPLGARRSLLRMTKTLRGPGGPRYSRSATPATKTCRWGPWSGDSATNSFPHPSDKNKCVARVGHPTLKSRLPRSPKARDRGHPMLSLEQQSPPHRS